MASHARADSIDAVAGPDAAARHTGAGVARRQAQHERMRDERAREAAAGDAELPPELDPAVATAMSRPVVGCCSRLAGGAV